MTNRRIGFHSGKLTAKQVTVNDTLTVNGNLTFGDASTDTLTVTGLSTFSEAMDVNATIDVDATTTSTNPVVDIANAGTGQGLRLDLNNTVDPGIGLEIDDEATGNTSEVIKLASKRTGTLVNVIAEADAAQIMTLEADAAGNSSAGLFIDINKTGIYLLNKVSPLIRSSK